MRIARYRTEDGRICRGIVEGDSITVIEGDPCGDWRKTRDKVSLDEVAFLAPVEPPNIIAIGLNYKDHAAEGGAKIPTAPVIFLKAASSLCNPDSAIVLPRMAPGEVDYEAELVVIIKKAAKNVSEEVVAKAAG